MKPWFPTVAALSGEDEPPSDEDARGILAAAEAIMNAQAFLPDNDLILFNLQTPVATRFVAWPVPYSQDSGRA